MSVVGSIAAFWSSADYLRSSPGNRHHQGRSPCLYVVSGLTPTADLQRPQIAHCWNDVRDALPRTRVDRPSALWRCGYKRRHRACRVLYRIEALLQDKTSLITASTATI